jgi:predicted  nucleic acid-binding Zn-ribbon protein
VDRISLVYSKKKEELETSQKEFSEALAEANQQMLKVNELSARVSRNEKELEFVRKKMNESYRYEEEQAVEDVRQQEAEEASINWAGGSSEDAAGEISEEAFQQALVDLFGDIPV